MKEVKKVIDINAHITNVECQIVVEQDIPKAIISFDNLGYGTITAVKFNATGYNSFGDVVQINGKDKFFLIIQDINIENNCHAKDLKAKMPNSDIRKLDLEECQICFADGSVITYAGSDIREFDIEEYDSVGADKERLDALKDKFSDRFKYKPKEVDDGWICGCGMFNTTSADTCSVCGNTKSDIFEAASDDSVKIIFDEYKKNEQAEQENEKKRTIKIFLGIVTATVICLVFAVLIGYSNMMSQRTTYSSQDEMKSALQGTYTYYDAYGNASRQIIISGDNATYKWNYSGSVDLNSTVKEWNYKKGTISTFETLIVTKEGYLKDGQDIYKKGGYIFSNRNSSSESTNKYESAYSVLKFSNINVTSNSSYTVCTGTVKNNGRKTYKFVKIKGSFKDTSGNVLDTDSTYAVGSEGLAAGESTTFRMSVPKNSKITSCSISILDYD